MPLIKMWHTMMLGRYSVSTLWCVQPHCLYTLLGRHRFISLTSMCNHVWGKGLVIFDYSCREVVKWCPKHTDEFARTIEVDDDWKGRPSEWIKVILLVVEFVRVVCVSLLPWCATGFYLVVVLLCWLNLLMCYVSSLFRSCPSRLSVLSVVRSCFDLAIRCSAGLQ